MDVISNQAPNGGLEQVSDLDVLKKMEDEHSRLQRQVRSIQTERQELERSMGVHPIFRRQDELLKVLKNEYVDLRKNLKIAHKKNDRRMKTQLKRALLNRVKQEQEKEEGLIVMDQLDDLVKRKSKHILNLRATFNANAGEIIERRAQSEQRLLSTENRLETATLRFNVVQYENQKIREEIECMLKDRALFNKAWDKMMKALNTGKRFLIDLFESSTLAYDQRDEWVSKLKAVQQKGRVEQMLHIQEMRDLQKAYDHEVKLYHFLSKKGLKRVNLEQAKRDEQMKLAEMERLDKELERHKKILQDVANYTGKDDIDRTIEQTRRWDSDNFSIYCLLTEFCAENTMLEKSLKKVQQDLLDRHEWNEKQEEMRQVKLESLKQRIEEQKMKNELLRNKVAEKNRIIDNAVRAINEIFTTLECSSKPFEDLLGDKTPSKWLLDLPLRLITEKIRENLELVYYYERVLSRKMEKTNTSSRLKKYTIYPTPPKCWTAMPINLLVPVDPCPACVETRWLSRITEEQEQPFTRDMALAAIKELSNDPAFLRSDRIHALVDCRVPRSRTLVAARNLGFTATTI